MNRVSRVEDRGSRVEDRGSRVEGPGEQLAAASLLETSLETSCKESVPSDNNHHSPSSCCPDRSMRLLQLRRHQLDRYLANCLIMVFPMPHFHCPTVLRQSRVMYSVIHYDTI
jgi:hypothetical protein